MAAPVSGEPGVHSQHVAERRARIDHAWKTIFLGDWHPVLRDPLDLFRLSFLVGAVVYALQGD